MAINIGNIGSNRGANNDNTTPTAPSRPVPKIQINTADSAVSSDFTRYVGYTDAVSFEKKLVELYIETKKDGLFIEKPVPKPSNPEVSKLSSIISIPQDLDKKVVTKIITQLQTAKLLDLNKLGSGKSPSDASEIICSVLDDVSAAATSPNAVKNTFVSLLCWFIRYSTYKLTNILYIGEISKSEVYWLYVMSKMGCKVTYVNYSSDSSYTATDPDSKYSVLIQGNNFTPLNIELGKINIAAYTQAAKVNEIVSKPSPVMLKYLTVLDETFDKELLTSLEMRQTKLVCTDTTIPLYFIAYIGYNEEIHYKNMLFTLKDEISRKNKPFVFLQELRKPTYNEATEYYSIQKTNDSIMVNLFASKISINDRIGRTILAQKAFLEAMSSIQTANLYNTAVQLCVWIKKFTSSIDFFNQDLPIIMYYGHATELELAFLNLMSQTGFDVIYFAPDKASLITLNKCGFNNLQIIEHQNSQANMPFPDRIIKTKLATTAYNAEKSLDGILYNDNTMFRNYQFKCTQNQTLKTTFEELGLMWHQESKYRTGFDSKGNYVVVPNIFAKVCGIDKGDLQAYYKDISFKLSPWSVYYYKVPFFKPAMTNDYYTTFYSGTKIDIDSLKRSRYNKYDYMTDDIQYLIFNKMQEVVDSGFIDVPQSDLLPLVIKTGLNIPPQFLQLLQSFDFTRNIPKIVIVSNGKQTFAVFECILLVLFNMIGFDIIVYTPTGYKNLESFIRPEAFQTFTLGEFKYDFSPQSLRIPKEIPHEKESIFERIFKGKNK